MWLSERHRETPRREEAGVGTVTLGGNPAGVYLAGERRNLPVLAPGGYAWAPDTGDQVLVIKTGADGEAPCVAASVVPGAVAPGTVQIFNGVGSASITLNQMGEIHLVGQVYVNGKPLGGAGTTEEEPDEPEDGDEGDEGSGGGDAGAGEGDAGGAEGGTA